MNFFVEIKNVFSKRALDFNAVIIGALINMELKVVYSVIHDASVDRYVLASQKKLRCAVGRWVGYQGCSDHDHLLSWRQTVAPRGRVITMLLCITYR